MYTKWIDEFEQTANAVGMGTWSEQAQPPSHRRADGLVQFWRELLSTSQADVFVAEIEGSWLFRTDPEEAGLSESWWAADYDDAGWEEIGLEGGWNGQGHPRYTGFGWYRKTFSVPDSLVGAEPLKLLFGAVDEDGEIWLNGEKMMDHTCAATGLTPGEIWITPFVVDPGPVLKRDGENLLALRVYNRLAMGGIWKPVYLLAGEEEGSLHLMLDALGGKLQRGNE